MYYKIIIFLTCAVLVTSSKQCDHGDGFFRDPQDCSVFYRCFGEQKIQLQCPHGTVFDTTVNVCNWPSKVECNNIGRLQESIYPLVNVEIPSSITINPGQCVFIEYMLNQMFASLVQASTGVPCKADECGLPFMFLKCQG